jgi:glycosyltransferase involved in cell wall biosynthesis
LAAERGVRVRARASVCGPVAPESEIACATMRQRHAVFVAFHVPPEASSSGVLRTLKYIRYLDELGWRVTVISPAVSAYEVTDPALEAQLPSSCRVERTPYLNTKRNLSLFGRYPALLAVPDRWLGWLPWGVAAGRKISEIDPFDVIYSTSPHATAHLIGWRIARTSRRPWVTDFRDPWFEEPPEPGAPTGPVFRTIDRWLERRVIERCTHVVTSTTQLRDLLRERYPQLPPAKVTAILNGYDEADFARLPPPGAGNSDRLLIVHAGSINPEFRDPRPLLRALRIAADRSSIDIARVRLRFLGGGEFGESATMRETLAACGVGGAVEFVGRVTYDEALREFGRADVLLLLQASEDTINLVPAKLYEYLRAQKPVLALVRPGAAAEILATTGGGWAVDPRDTEALTRGVADVYEAWRTGTLQAHSADLAALRQFDRKVLTGQLATVFEEALRSVGHG